MGMAAGFMEANKTNGVCVLVGNVHPLVGNDTDDDDDTDDVCVPTKAYVPLMNKTPSR